MSHKVRALVGLASATLAAGALTVLPVSPALAGQTSNPSYICTNDFYFSFEAGTNVFNPNGGVSHGGCTSTDAKYGYADLENEPVLSTAALASNCKLISQMFLQMVDPANGGPPLAAYPITLPISGVTVNNPTELGSYAFHDIFGPNPSTCQAVLAADHATIATGMPYDVYYTGGAGQNTTYAPGVPADLAAVGFGQ